MNLVFLLKDYLVALRQLAYGDRLRGERKMDAERQNDLGSLIDFSRSLRILDLANGRLRPQYMLLQAQGFHAGPNTGFHEGKFPVVKEHPDFFTEQIADPAEIVEGKNPFRFIAEHSG